MILYHNEMTEEQLYRVEAASAVQDHYFDAIHNIGTNLTRREYSTLYQLYILGYSINEIALREGVSRQSVNRTKIRALAKLR